MLSTFNHSFFPSTSNTGRGRADSSKFQQYCCNGPFVLTCLVFLFWVSVRSEYDIYDRRIWFLLLPHLFFSGYSPLFPLHSWSSPFGRSVSPPSLVWYIIPTTTCLVVLYSLSLWDSLFRSLRFPNLLLYPAIHLRSQYYYCRCTNQYHVLRVGSSCPFYYVPQTVPSALKTLLHCSGFCFPPHILFCPSSGVLKNCMPALVGGAPAARIVGEWVFRIFTSLFHHYYFPGFAAYQRFFTSPSSGQKPWLQASSLPIPGTRSNLTSRKNFGVPTDWPSGYFSCCWLTLSRFPVINFDSWKRMYRRECSRWDSNPRNWSWRAREPPVKPPGFPNRSFHSSTFSSTSVTGRLLSPRDIPGTSYVGTKQLPRTCIYLFY